MGQHVKDRYLLRARQQHAVVLVPGCRVDAPGCPELGVQEDSRGQPQCLENLGERIHVRILQRLADRSSKRPTRASHKRNPAGGASPARRATRSWHRNPTQSFKEEEPCKPQSALPTTNAMRSASTFLVASAGRSIAT